MYETAVFEIELQDDSHACFYVVDGFYHPTWWINDERSNLLAVLWEAHETDRQQIVDVHKIAMEKAWEHYWAAQALWGKAGEGVEKEGRGLVDDVCPDCLDGEKHLEEIYNEAGELAQDLGEILAAYDNFIFLGDLRR